MKQGKISRESMDKAARDLPIHQANNRLLAKGWTREQVNQYLKQTPMDQIKAENRKAQQKK